MLEPGASATRCRGPVYEADLGAAARGRESVGRRGLCRRGLRRWEVGCRWLGRWAVRRQVESVPDVAHRADQLVVLRAELGAQPADVHVHGAGAAEVVIPPQLLTQLCP